MRGLSGKNGRILAAVVAGVGLGLGGGSVALGTAQASTPGPTAASHALRPLVGHRIAGRRPRSAFAPSPGHLRGPRKAVPGTALPGTPGRLIRLTARDRAEVAAFARARQTGRPVLVAAETTPTVEVVAHPGGMLSMTSHVFPVRVKVHGVWQAIDPRLVRTASGSWAAAVASVPVTFSGGGTGPLVSVANAAGQTVAMYWPAALPRPVVSGAVALYPDVLPGVDLRMNATGIGYQEALVVHSAAAAASARLRSISYRLRVGRGLVLRRGPAGSLGVLDAATGKLVFVVGQPQMWDSSRSRPIPVRPSADEAGSGRVTAVPVSYRLAGPAAATIAMTPPSAALTGPRVRYPLFIDPEIAPGTAYYVQLMRVSNGYTQKWNTTTGTTSQPSGQVEVGDCGYSSCLWNTPSGAALGYVDRDYFRFNTPDLLQRDGEAAHIYYASFDIEQTANSNGCTDRLTDLYTSGVIDSSTTWGGPEGSKVGTEQTNRGGGSACPPGNVQFDSDDTPGDGGMKSYLQQDADNNWGNITFELRADSETVDLQYKLFKDNPSISVYYNFAPLVVDDLSVQDQVTCDPSVTYTSLTQPTLSARGTDNNPGTALQITLNPTLDTSAGAAAGGTLSHPTGASGSVQAMTMSSPLANGTAYQFQATATNNPGNETVDTVTVPKLTGAASPWYPFTVLTGPTAAPAISSFDYPQGQWGQPAGAPGVFTVGTSGQSNIAGFAYAFDSGASEPVPDTSDCSYLADGGLGTSANANGGGNPKGELALNQGSTAQIQVPQTLAAGQHTLYVVSFDKAHNASKESAYTFYVAPNYQAASQPITYTDASSLVSSATVGGGAAQAMVVSQAQTCCNRTSWRGGSQMLFNSSAAGQSVTLPITVPAAGTWELGADMTTSTHYGEVRADLDQSTSDINLGGTSSAPFDGYSPVTSNAYLDLGTRTLTAGTHTLTFTISGQDANALGFQAGINYLVLSPTSRYEAENLLAGTPTAGSLAPQIKASSPWSDNGQLLLTNTTLGATFTVSFNAPVESDYALGVKLTTGPSYGSLRFDLDPAATDINLDNTASSPLDAYSASVSATYVFLGGVHLKPGTHVLQLTVTGTDPSSTGDRYDAGLDFLEVVPVTGATDASFTSAMNNLGIATDGATSFAGNFDLFGSTTGKNLSLQAMQNAGITPGTATSAGATFMMNGATFTMPQLSTSSGAVIDDNVIPDGQTIPLPAADQVKATDVALLATSTCGASPVMTATLNYSNNVGSNQPVITSVTDWTTPNFTTAGVQAVLSHWDVGTTADATTHPGLFEVLLPANPNGTLASITLPVMPVNFLTNTGSCTTSASILHILAIGIRPVSAGQGPSGSAWTGGYAGPMDTAVTPPGGSLSDVTLREVVAATTAGGGSVRIELSNFAGTVPVMFDAVTVGAQNSGQSTVAAPVPVDFGGQASVTIPVGGDVYSDPVARPAGGTGALVVSMHIPSSSAETSVPVHQTSSTFTFYAAGNQTANSDGTPFTAANFVAGLYYLARVDVTDATATHGTVAVLGDQTAMQAPAVTFGYWAADLPAAFSAAAVTLPGSIANVASSGTTITTANALSWLRDYVTAEPNLRDVIISAGANDVLAGQSATTIESNLRTLVSAIQNYFVDNDPSLVGVQVILTTIVPLGLAATDAKEAVRQAVNTWITGNNAGAQVTSDIATAVAQPGSPNNINPSLLSGGVPTAQYYTTIARQIASDISNAITNIAIGGL